MKLTKLVFLLLLLTSCANNNDRIQISIIGENTSTIQAYMSLESEYETLHPDIDLVFHPNTFDDAFSKINQDLANHTGLYDIVMQYNFSLSSFVRNEYVYFTDELTEQVDPGRLEFQDDLFDQTWEAVGHYYANSVDSANGTMTVGYPYVANSILLVYNKEMFGIQANQEAFQERYGRSLTIPQTWEEFYQVAEFFTDEEKGTYGVCLEGASGAFLYFEFANYLHSFGGSVLNKDLGWEGNASTEVVLDSPEAEEALSFFRSLKPFNNGGFTTVEQFREMEIMKEGQTAMSLSWEDIISLNIQESPDFSDTFGFAPIPGNKSIIGGGAFFINRDSENPRAAFDFILYALQPEVQKMLALQGLSSPLESVYQDTRVLDVAHMEALKESLERGDIFLEAGPDSDMIAETLSTYIQKVWQDEISVEQALEQAAREINTKRAAIYQRL